MRTRWLVLTCALLVGFALAAAGCGSAGEETRTGSGSPRAVETEVGDFFSFSLDADPTTGYTWTLAKPPDEKVVRMTASRFHGGGRPGAGGQEEFWFEAVGEGATTIELEHRRPWEEAAAPEDTHQVRVEVRGSDVGQVTEYTDPGNPIDVAVGQEFVIALDSNPTTGYRWSLAAPLPENVALVQTGYTPEEGPLVGSDGKEYWRFGAVKAGSSTIELQYSRPWESGEPETTRAFTVNVD